MLDRGEDQYVTVAKLLGPYGVRGWLKLRSFTHPESTVFDYQPWYLLTSSGSGIPGPGQQKPVKCDPAKCDSVKRHPIKIAEYKKHGRGWVVLIDVCGDRNAAEALGQAQIQVSRSCLPELPSDEYYWRDLVGCRVVERAQGELGRVIEFLETGGHDVMSVALDSEVSKKSASQRKSGDNCLIPFVLGVYVDQVDLVRREIRVNWPWLDMSDL